VTLQNNITVCVIVDVRRSTLAPHWFHSGVLLQHVMVAIGCAITYRYLSLVGSSLAPRVKILTLLILGWGGGLKWVADVLVILVQEYTNCQNLNKIAYGRQP